MIREATEKDIKDILEIYNHAIINTTAVYTYKSQTLEEKMQWYEEKKKSGCPLFVYEEDNKVAGFATFGSFRDWPAYKYSIEHSVYVNNEYRRKGIATQLMKKLIDAANEMGYKTMVAGIDADNEESIKLHEKLGFTHCGTVTKVGYKFGRWLNLAFYQIDLTGPKNPVEE